MSKRANEAALREYPPSYSEGNRNAKRIQSYKVDTHKPIRQIYIKCYEQAEKDLSLTWEDIYQIIYDYINISRLPEFQHQEYVEPKLLCEEVLRRFNEQREKQ